MAEGAFEKPVAKRRRRSARRTDGSWGQYLRGREFAQLVFYGMCALGLAYAAKFVWDARMATIGVQGVTPQDVRYVHGAPEAVEDGGRLYRYDDSRRVALARFGEDGLLASFSCSSARRHARLTRATTRFCITTAWGCLSACAGSRSMRSRSTGAPASAAISPGHFGG